MTASHDIRIAPAFVGSLLWAGASALLIEDSFHTGNWTVSTALQPVLTASAVASAVWVHHSLAEWKPIRALGFLLLAILASVACIWGTLGKLADAQDAKSGDALRQNRNLSAKLEELATAKRGSTLECGKIGPRCTQWQARVDALTKEAAGLQLVSDDPRADALGRLAGLVGYNAEKVKAIATAITPLLLPVTLELGSILFWAAAFRGRERATETATHATLTVATARPWSQAEALAQFRQMREVGAQQFLAGHWGVDKSTVSRWLAAWETKGLIQRRRDGRCKSVMLPGRNLPLL